LTHGRDYILPVCIVHFGMMISFPVDIKAVLTKLYYRGQVFLRLGVYLICHTSSLSSSMFTDCDVIV